VQCAEAECFFSLGCGHKVEAAYFLARPPCLLRRPDTTALNEELRQAFSVKMGEREKHGED